MIYIGKKESPGSELIKKLEWTPGLFQGKSEKLCQKFQKRIMSQSYYSPGNVFNPTLLSFYLFGILLECNSCNKNINIRKPKSQNVSLCVLVWTI